jgi:hypothetical protein
MRATYALVEKDAGWMVRFNGREFGPYADRDVVIAATVRAAARAETRGCLAHVMVHDGQSFRTVWMKGQMHAASERGMTA